MVKRTIVIRSDAYIHMKDKLLTVVVQKEPIAKLPLEDLGVIVLESTRSTVSTAALASIMNAGIELVICGYDHLPNGYMTPLAKNCRNAAVGEDQIHMSLPLKKRLWQKIVQAKIANQAKVLELLQLKSDKLKKLSDSVLSGDKNNRESVAAVAYFKQIMADGGRHNSPNSAALDYGYTVLRSGIARSLVAGGWIVSQGIHHHNIDNSFNLADDIIEPFRPLVDLLVIERNITGALVPEEKAQLSEVFEMLMTFEDKKCSCDYCIDQMVKSLRTATLQKDAKYLKIPQVIALEKVMYE